MLGSDLTLALYNNNGRYVMKAEVRWAYREEKENMLDHVESEYTKRTTITALTVFEEYLN